LIGRPIERHGGIRLIRPAEHGDAHDSPEDDLKRITKRTRVIAVIMPNDEEKVRTTRAGCRVSVRHVERLSPTNRWWGP
jgi:hypothetical protein